MHITTIGKSFLAAFFLGSHTAQIVLKHVLMQQWTYDF